MVNNEITITGPVQPKPKPNATPKPKPKPKSKSTMDASAATTMKLRVLHPTGKIDELEIEQDRVLIGAGAHCDIRIDGARAGPEHVVVKPLGDGQLALRGLFFAPPALFRGTPIAEMRVPSGSQIAVCGTRITFEIVRKKERAGRRTGRRFGAAMLVAFVLVVVPTLVFARLRGGGGGSSPFGHPPPPAVLFDDEPVACKASSADQAQALARRQRALALARRERHPFSVEDGIAAVPAFRLAAACYRKADHFSDASESASDGSALRARIEQDYFVHRVRFEHSIETDDVRGALVEVRTLRKMTAHRKGAYSEWLGVVERRIEGAVREAEERAAAGSGAFGNGLKD